MESIDPLVFGSGRQIILEYFGFTMEIQITSVSAVHPVFRPKYVDLALT